MARPSPRLLTYPRWVHGTTVYRPHIYLHKGAWWVLCKHRNRTGPYTLRSTAFEVAHDIWSWHHDWDPRARGLP